MTHDELMNAVWKDTFVEDTNLRYCIHSLRKIFAEDFIETIPKRGYRFNAEIKSFTQEEFIKRHTGDYRVENLVEGEFPPKNTPEKPLPNGQTKWVRF